MNGSPDLKHHMNIAMDQQSHLTVMDHIVDDLSRDIRSINPSPCAKGEDDQNKVTIMKGFGRRTIKLSESTFDLDQQHSENKELDFTSENSDWKQKTRIIKKRPKGWMKRFQKDMRDGRVEYVRDHENVLARVKSFRSLELAACWNEPLFHSKRPVKPKEVCLSDLKPDSDRLRKSSLCLVCFNMVGFDAERVSCGNCPVVAHSSCMKTNISADTNKECPPAKYQQEEGSYGWGVINDTFNWTCPFCIHEVKLLNKYRKERYDVAKTSHSEKVAILLLQSHVRMFPIKKRYNLMVAAAIKLQRFHRSQHLRRALIRERLAQRRPVRVFIHEVTVYDESYNLAQSQDKFRHMRDFALEQPGVNHPRIFCQFGTSYLPKNTSNVLVPPVSPDSLSALPHHMTSLKATNTELRRDAVMNMLQLAHMMQPQAPVAPVATSSVIYPPETLFLTVTVSRFEHGIDRQLYRDDAPLYPMNSPSIQAKLPEFSGHFKVVDEVSKVVEGGLAKNSGAGVRILKVFPPRSMLILPACPADVTIHHTLSKVSEWPNAHIMGQSSFQADNLSIWRQCSCLSQNISTSNIEEPEHDSGSRLHFTTRASTASDPSPVALERSRAVFPEIRRPSTRNSRIGTARSSKVFDPPSRRVLGGRILWSFISTPTRGNQFGFLYFLPQLSQLTYKKKTWCVLMDGQLMIYSRASDFKPKEVIELKSCYFNVIEKEVMKIFRPKDEQSWHCVCSCSQKKRKWIDTFRENTIVFPLRTSRRNKGMSTGSSKNR